MELNIPMPGQTPAVVCDDIPMPGSTKIPQNVDICSALEHIPTPPLPSEVLYVEKEVTDAAGGISIMDSNLEQKSNLPPSNIITTNEEDNTKVQQSAAILPTNSPVPIKTPLLGIRSCKKRLQAFSIQKKSIQSSSILPPTSALDKPATNPAAPASVVPVIIGKKTSQGQLKVSLQKPCMVMKGVDVFHERVSRWSSIEDAPPKKTNKKVKSYKHPLERTVNELNEIKRESEVKLELVKAGVPLGMLPGNAMNLLGFHTRVLPDCTIKKQKLIDENEVRILKDSLAGGKKKISKYVDKYIKKRKKVDSKGDEKGGKARPSKNNDHKYGNKERYDERVQRDRGRISKRDDYRSSYSTKSKKRDEGVKESKVNLDDFVVCDSWTPSNDVNKAEDAAVDGDKGDDAKPETENVKSTVLVGDYGSDLDDSNIDGCEIKDAGQSDDGSKNERLQSDGLLQIDCLKSDVSKFGKVKEEFFKSAFRSDTFVHYDLPVTKVEEKDEMSTPKMESFEDTNTPERLSQISEKEDKNNVVLYSPGMESSREATPKVVKATGKHADEKMDPGNAKILVKEKVDSPWSGKSGETKGTKLTVEYWESIEDACKAKRHVDKKCERMTVCEPPVKFSENMNFCSCAESQDKKYEKLNERAEAIATQMLSNTSNEPEPSTAREWYPSILYSLKDKTAIELSTNWETDDSQPENDNIKQKVSSNLTADNLAKFNKKISKPTANLLDISTISTPVAPKDNVLPTLDLEYEKFMESVGNVIVKNDSETEFCSNKSYKAFSGHNMSVANGNSQFSSAKSRQSAEDSGINKNLNSNNEKCPVKDDGDASKREKKYDCFKNDFENNSDLEKGDFKAKKSEFEEIEGSSKKLLDEESVNKKQVGKDTSWSGESEDEEVSKKTKDKRSSSRASIKQDKKRKGHAKVSSRRRRKVKTAKNKKKQDDDDSSASTSSDTSSSSDSSSSSESSSSENSSEISSSSSSSSDSGEDEKSKKKRKKRAMKKKLRKKSLKAKKKKKKMAAKAKELAKKLKNKKKKKKLKALAKQQKDKKEDLEKKTEDSVVVADKKKKKDKKKELKKQMKVKKLKEKIKEKRAKKKKQKKHTHTTSESSSDSENESSKRKSKKKGKKRRLNSIDSGESVAKKKSRIEKDKSVEEEISDESSENEFDADVVVNIKREKMSDEEHTGNVQFSPRLTFNKNLHPEIISVSELHSDFVESNKNNVKVERDVETIKSATQSLNVDVVSDKKSVSQESEIIERHDESLNEQEQDGKCSVSQESETGNEACILNEKIDSKRCRESHSKESERSQTSQPNERSIDNSAEKRVRESLSQESERVDDSNKRFAERDDANRNRESLSQESDRSSSKIENDDSVRSSDKSDSSSDSSDSEQNSWDANLSLVSNDESSKAEPSASRFDKQQFKERVKVLVGLGNRDKDVEEKIADKLRVEEDARELKRQFDMVENYEHPAEQPKVMCATLDVRPIPTISEVLPAGHQSQQGGSTRGEIKWDWRPTNALSHASMSKPSRWGMKTNPALIEVELKSESEISLPGHEGAGAEASPPAQRKQQSASRVYRIPTISSCSSSLPDTGEEYEERQDVSYEADYADMYAEEHYKEHEEQRAGSGRPRNSISLDERISMVLQYPGISQAVTNGESEESPKQEVSPPTPALLTPDKGILIIAGAKLSRSDPRVNRTKRVSFLDGLAPGQDSDDEKPPPSKKARKSGSGVSRRRPKLMGHAYPCPPSWPDYDPLWDRLPPPPPPPPHPVECH